MPMAMGANPGAHEGKCMDTSKILFDYGTVQSSHVGIDVLNPIKMRITVVLDHEVDGSYSSRRGIAPSGCIRS